MNGFLLKCEEVVFLVSHGLDNPSIADIRVTINSYDEDNDGTINLKEFSKNMQVYRNYRDRN